MENFGTKLKDSISNKHANPLTLVSGGLCITLLLIGAFSTFTYDITFLGVKGTVSATGSLLYRFLLIETATLALIHIAFRVIRQASGVSKTPYMTFLFETTLYIALGVNYLLFMIFGKYSPGTAIKDTEELVKKVEQTISWGKIIGGITGIVMLLEAGLLMFTNMFKDSDSGEEN